MIEVLSWYILIMLLGWLALPISFVIFGRLPDRGYSFSKPLGLLLGGLLAWWIGNLKIIGFQWYTCWVAVGLLELLSFLLLWFKPDLRKAMRDWFGRASNLRLALGSELVFLLAFAFIINARSFMPALNQSEKFFDLAFIQAIATSPTLPAPDPWFGGQPMNYYYGGQFLLAFLVKLSGIPAATAYNIGMGLVFGLATQATYGLAGNLVGLIRQKVQASLRASLLGATLIMVLGNLVPLRQVMREGLLPLSNPNFPFFLNWWNTARIIFDPMPPDGKPMDLLTEYPIYSYLNGDLHAHLIDAPFVLLALGFMLNCFLSPRKWVLGRPHWSSLPRFLAGGVLVGALAFTNGGDFLTFLVITGLVLLLAEVRQAGSLLSILGRWVVQMVGLGCLILLAYYFYFSLFNGMVRAIPDATYGNMPVIGLLSRYVGWVNWPRTFLAEFVVMYGLFLLPILTFFGLELVQIWRMAGQNNPATLPRWAALAKWPLSFGLIVLGGLHLPKLFSDLADKNLTLTSCVISLATFTLSVWLLWPNSLAQLWRRPRLALEGLAFLVVLIIGPFIRFELLGPGLLLFYISLRLLIRKILQPAYRSDLLTLVDVFALLCVAVAAGLTLFCELFYIKDIYTNRFNTMMKFWYQLWVLYGIAGVYFTVRVVGWRWPVLSNSLRETRSYFWKPKFGLPGNVRAFWAGLTALGNFSSLKQAEVQVTEGPDFNHYNTASVIKTAPEIYSGPDRPGFSSNPEFKPVPPVESGQPWYLRRVWTVLMALLMLSATALPVLGYYQMTNHYTNRVGLNGESWYAESFPDEYPAMQFLRNYTINQPSRRGVVLEANGMNYSWGNRVSTYTGLPTIVGWPFHELQWRGNLPELEIWESWLDMDRIYEMTDRTNALALLKKHNVRYVFVGQAENGSRSLFSDQREFKKYSPEALAKFGDFMKTIYADSAHNIYIYAFE